METTGPVTDRAGMRQSIGRDGRPSHAVYRWFVLLLVWGAFLMSCVDRVAWSTIAAPVGNSLGLKVDMLGSFVTAFYIGYVIANIFGGLVTDAMGGRKMLALAMIPLGIATFGFSFTRNLHTGLAIQFVMGLAGGADYSAGVKLISSWFGRERGRALGIYATATSLSVVLTNATVPSMSAAHGWQSVFQVLGGVTLCWGIICAALLRNGSAASENGSKITRAEISILLRNRNLICLALAGCGALWATVGFSAWSNALMTKAHGISPILAGSIIATFGLAGAIGKPLVGWLLDIFHGSAKVLSIVCMICFAGTMVMFGQCSTIPAFHVLAPVLGVVAFGTTPLFLTQVTWVSGEKYAGAAAGLTNAVQQCGSALAPIVVGGVFAIGHSFQMAFLTLAMGPLIGLIALLFLAGQTQQRR
ncbi:MFS transporter [Paraburkholderia sacchari]|uniref:MFS transporter n=1 Tax=Paraburkholderia sacchari TaxID=159450 RepID=UPI0039A54CA3